MYKGYKRWTINDYTDPWRWDEDYDPLMNKEQYLDSLKLKNKYAIFPSNNELFLDIDTEEQIKAFRKALDVLHRNDDRFFDLKDIWIKKSSTKDHFHIIIKLPFQVTAQQRILLQACLGSDNVREILSYLRLENGDFEPTLFAEKY